MPNETTVKVTSWNSAKFITSFLIETLDIVLSEIIYYLSDLNYGN